MPTAACSVPKCSNRGGHKFPVDESHKNQWILGLLALKTTIISLLKTVQIHVVHFTSAVVRISDFFMRYSITYVMEWEDLCTLIDGYDKF